jgi:hypothetical protein
LTKVTIRQRLIWLSQESIPELIADDRRRKETVQRSTTSRRLLEALG